MKAKKENNNIGFYYTVTDQQIKEYRKWSLEQKFKWLEETARFIYSIQSKEERKRMRSIKNQVI